jgi:hypothetical protein
MFHEKQKQGVVHVLKSANALAYEHLDNLKKAHELSLFVRLTDSEYAFPWV